MLGRALLAVRRLQTYTRILPLVGLLLGGCVTTVDNAYTRKASTEKALQSHIQLGLAYIQQGDYVTAHKRLERALEIDPKSAGAHAALGLVFQRQGEPDLAEKSFRRALSYDSGYTRGRTYYAAFLYEQGRFADAAEQLRKASEDTTFEDRAQVFVNLGHCYARLEQLDDALAAYQRALSLTRAPQPNVVLAISRLHQMRGEPDSAWRYYQQYLEYVRSGLATHSASSLKFGIDLAHAVEDRDREASLRLLLRNLYPNSPEAKEYQDKP